MARARYKKPNTGVRFARVPSGGETCPFCIMLASRGAVYYSEQSAGADGHYHANCRCRIVPSWNGAAIEGYDPALYYDMWKHPEKYAKPESGTSISAELAEEVTEAGQYAWTSDYGVTHSVETINMPGRESGGFYLETKCDVFQTEEGIKLIFPQGYDISKQPITPQRAIAILDNVPEEIRRQMQREIYFVDYENPQDDYWRRVYRSFPKSFATGGRKLTFYGIGEEQPGYYIVHTYCHEAGHYIDQALASGGQRFSKTQEWIDAMLEDFRLSGKRSPSGYGENSETEDFAESVAFWARHNADFTAEFPNRAAILRRIFS